MRALAAVAAILLAMPLAHAVPLPGAAVPPTPAEPARAAAVDPVMGLLVRQDPDGNRTLLLHVEDEPGGSYAYTAVRTPAQVPDVREAGAFVHAYARADGTPMLAAGAYLASAAVSQGKLLRVPLVLLEGAPTTAAFQAEVLNLASEALQMEQNAFPFLAELLLPELQDHFGAPPGPEAFTQYRDHPTLYVWGAARTTPAGESWAGLYLARTGSVVLDAEGRVARAVRDAELGAAARDAAGTQRLAGAYLENVYEASARPGATAHADTFVAGLAGGAAGRVPLAVLRLEDERAGGDLADRPRVQRTGASVGVSLQGEHVPLLGVETVQTEVPSQHGHEVTRVTSAGPYVQGSYVPVAGVRYHSDFGELLEAAGPLVNPGPGAPDAGFEVDVGPFVDGAYVPAAGAVVRPHFREAFYQYQTFVGLGAYTPLGFAPLAVVTYDGNRPLLPWVSALSNGEAVGDAWLVAAGTTAAGSYVPFAGVQGVGRDPLGTRAQQQEVRLGVFAGSYRAWVPLASASWDADRRVQEHALGFVAGGTLGSPNGDFDVRAGAYALDSYVPLAGLQYRSHWDGGEARETAIVLGAYGPGGFVPLAGAVYESQAAFVPAQGSAGNLNDDTPWVLRAGAFGPDGSFVPLLTVRRIPGAVTVTVGPPLGV